MQKIVSMTSYSMMYNTPPTGISFLIYYRIIACPMAASLEEMFFLIVGIASLFPTVVLLRQYKYARITDYLFFSAAFFFNSVMQFTFYLIESDAKLIYFQIAYGSQVLFYFLFYLHASQIEWAKPPKLISTIGWGWPILLLILIAFWSKQTFES